MNLAYIPQPIPFYTTTSLQLFRQPYTGTQPQFKQIVLIFSDGGIPPTWQIRLPPVQIKRAKTGAAISSFVVKTLTGTQVLSIPTTGFELHDLDDTNTHEAVVLNTEWETGTGTTIQPDTYYYFEATDGTNTWYSESFYTVSVNSTSSGFPTDNCTRVIRLHWGVDCNIDGLNPDGTVGGLVSYNFPGFQMFMEADPGRPDYVYEEEGEVDANGLFVPDMRMVKKKWEIEVLADERIVDALNLIPVFDTVTMYYPNNNTVVFNRVDVETEWLDNRVQAKVRLKCYVNQGLRQGCC